MKLSPNVQAAVDAVEAAERLHRRGRDPDSTIEILKLAVAEAVIAESRQRDRLPQRAAPVKADIRRLPRQQNGRSRG